MNKVKAPGVPAKSHVQLPSNKQEVDTACQLLFERVVTRNYLHELSKCEVHPLSKEVSYPSVRWYKIDKIVIEKNTFFADKLSMLFISLHKTAKNVVLVLNKQRESEIELYLGARDFEGNNKVSGEIIESGLSGFFPGIGSAISFLPALSFSPTTVASVSAIASLRDDKKEFFVQGIERLINSTSSIPSFRAYFIADSVSDAEVTEMIDAFSNLYSRLSPAENLQMTFNESESKGVTESFSESFTESIGESISKTVTHTDGFSFNRTDGKTKTNGSSENISRNIVASIWHGIFGGKTGGGTNESRSTSNSTSIGLNFSDSQANQEGLNKSQSKGNVKQKGSSTTQTKGIAKQITYKNRSVKYYLDILDKQLERLQNGRPFGLWSTATYFVSKDKTSTQQLASIYRGAIIGEESGLETCAINTWDNKKTVQFIDEYLNKSLHPRFNYFSLDVSAGSVVTSKELAIHLSLPQSSVPGVIVEERASFARNVISEKAEDADDYIEIGKVTHLGKVSETPVRLSLKELTKHTFVTGSTGSGKSNALYLILSQIKAKGKHFMVIEPAKGEYKHVFGFHDDVTVYSNTNKVGELLRINPFVFPHEHMDVLEHIDGLVEIFNACWPMYAAMPAVLKHSVIKAYEKCGWDIDLSVPKSSPVFPTIEDVVVCLSEYIDQSNYSADTKGDYKGALEVRLQELCDGMFGRMLNGDSIPDEKLFNSNVIVDLSRIKSTETKSLLIGFLVLKLNEFRMSEGGMNEPLKHVTVLEEAHNLLKRTSVEQSQESSNLTGKSVEMISNSIAEMRTYGEAFIIVDQSPSMLDQSAIRNTNTKIVLTLPAKEDRDVAGGSMSLRDDQIEEIGKENRGEAIVYQNNWEEPVQCMIDLYRGGTHVFSKSSTPVPRPSRKPSVEVVRFLLYPYLKEPFDLEVISNHLRTSAFPSSVTFTLNELLDEYKANRSISLWKDYHLAALSKVVKDYLGIDSDYRSILEQHKNMLQVRVVFDELLKDRLSRDISLEMLYYVERCYVRNLALFEQWRETFKTR